MPDLLEMGPDQQLAGHEMGSHGGRPWWKSRKRAANCTPKEGRYLAYIYYYTKLHRQAPAERDMQQYFPAHAAGRA